MKKLLLFLTILSVAVVFVACKSGPVADTKTTTIDTSGLAAFQQFKSLNEQKALAMYYAQQTTPQTEPAAKTIVYKKATAPKKRVVVNDDGAMASESANLAKVKEKKGWSKAAKGATIGTVAGAAAGAVINKRNRVLGGVIGGVAGGVIGYGVGRGIDKKDGRY